MVNFKQELVKKLLFSFLILIVPVVVMFFLSWDVSRRAEMTKILRQNLSDRSESLSLYVKLQNQAAEVEPYYNVLENVLPGRDQLFDFQKEMGMLAAQAGVGFGFNFLKETAPSLEAAGRMGFNLITEGTIFKIAGFIKSIENSRFLVDFKSFDFTGAAVNMTGEVLFYF